MLYTLLPCHVSEAFWCSTSLWLTRLALATRSVDWHVYFAIDEQLVASQEAQYDPHILQHTPQILPIHLPSHFHPRHDQ